jgi:hypothetical protein
MRRVSAKSDARLGTQDASAASSLHQALRPCSRAAAKIRPQKPQEPATRATGTRALRRGGYREARVQALEAKPGLTFDIHPLSRYLRTTF